MYIINIIVNCNIEDEGAMKLGLALNCNNTLEVLNLCINYINRRQ